MTCEPLPATGLGANIELLLGAGLVCLLVGAALLTAARRAERAPRHMVVTLVFLLGAGALIGTPDLAEPAQAAGSSCSTSTTSDSRLKVMQTSTMTGLAPGAVPALITGQIANQSTQSTRVATVEVAITAVTPAPGATAGVCRPSDYLILESQMRLERNLEPGAVAPFSGARIGLANKTINQDACQGATVHLQYTANPH